MNHTMYLTVDTKEFDAHMNEMMRRLKVAAQYAPDPPHVSIPALAIAAAVASKSTRRVTRRSFLGLRG